MKYGNEIPALDRDDHDRFWASLDKREKCWIWNAEARKGYGRFTINGKQYAAHRVAWVMVKGAEPRSEVLDHVCRNPLCVNPDCLDEVTQSVNCERGVNGYGSRDMCRAGLHDIADIANVLAGKNGRQCRACSTEAKRRYEIKKRQDPAFRERHAARRKEWGERTNYQQPPHGKRVEPVQVDPQPHDPTQVMEGGTQ